MSGFKAGIKCRGKIFGANVVELYKKNASVVKMNDRKGRTERSESNLKLAGP